MTTEEERRRIQEETEREKKFSQVAISFNSETPFKLRELARQRRKQRGSAIWIERTNFQKVEAITRLLGSLPDHLMDEVFKYSIKNGYNPARLVPIIEELRQEREQQAKIEKAQVLENQKQTQERNRFPNVFLRLCNYIGLENYEAQLTEAAKKATLPELQEAQKRLLSAEGRNLSESVRAKAQAWIATLIQQRQPNASSKSPLEKARSIFNLSRGH